MTGKERIQAMIDGKPVDRLPLMPITMMFAADRIGVKYKDYATGHRVMVEAQIHTATEFGFDYVSAISDPAREAADCGAFVHFYDDQPPSVDESQALLADKTKLKTLSIPSPTSEGRMRDRVQAIALFRESIGEEKLIEGWIEGPCAEAADLRGINTLMTDFFDDPGFVRDLMEFVLTMELNFAKHQIDAGANIIGIGDAAASLVGPTFYREFVWPMEKKMVEGVHRMGAMVRLHICGKTRPILKEMGQLKCEIVDLDWMNPIADGREAMGEDQVLLGNIDPVAVLQNGTPEEVYEALRQCHREAGARYIVGAGCEVTRKTPLENIRAMMAYARDGMQLN